jgi:hypothetical protein
MSKTLALGTELAMGDGATPEVFTKIPLTSQISVGPPVKAKVDVTNNDSTDREYIQGLGEDGEATLTIIWDSDEPQLFAFLALQQVTTPTNFRITLPDTAGTLMNFSATVNYTWQLIEDDAIKLDFTLSISGSFTIT